MQEQPSTEAVVAHVAATGKRRAEDLAKRMMKMSEGEPLVTVLRAVEVVALNAFMNLPEGMRQAHLGQFIYALCGDIMVNVEQAEKSPGTEATGQGAEEVEQRG